MNKKLPVSICLIAATISLSAQHLSNPNSNHGNAFEELNYLLASPNEYRTASGAPGPKYWQQRADYDIAVDIDEANNILTGKETVTYFNNSPDILTYIWLQLDENFHNPDVEGNHSRASRIQEKMTEAQIQALEPWRNLKGYGVNITNAADAAGKALKYTINQTMMRIDLPSALKPGE